MPKNSVNIGLSIPKDMHQWLESKEGKRCVPNKSQIFQNAINHIRFPKNRKMHPMSILVIVMGMSFGLASIVASRTMFFDWMMSTTLFLIGAVIILAALVTMIKEFREKNASRIP